MRAWRWVLGGVAAALIACTGMGSAPPTHNGEACRRYVEHLNGLECLAVHYLSDEVCSGVEEAPADMATYFDCARENAYCESGAAVVALDRCRQPLM